MANIENIRKLEKIIVDGGELNDAQEESLRKKIDEYWDDHTDVLHRFPRWKKYIAWVAGYQLYDYNKYSRELIEVPLKRKKKLVFNRLRSFVRATLAKLNADVPQMSVIPRTNENEDIEAARAGNKLIEHLSDKVNLPGITNDLKLWQIITNRAFIRVFWDSESYGTLGYKDGEEIVQDGDLNMESVSPFNCRVDPLYFEHEKWRWFVFGEEVDAVALEDEYDVKKGILQETSQTLNTAYGLESHDAFGTISGESSTQEHVTGRTIVLKELWTPKIFVFTAGSEILDYGVHDYGEIPFYPIEERLVPISSYEKGFQFNEPLVKDAIVIQREYNRMYSLKSIALERASKLKVMVPFGSMVSKKQFTNDYATFVDYNPKMQGKPEQLRLDPLPAFVETYTNNLEREFEMAFGVREASFGRLPERASHASGTLVNLLLEQDDVLLNPLLATINKALSKAWSLALRIVRNNYDLDRLIKYTGEDEQRSVMKFKGADLAGNTDVKVVSQAGLPRSRALRIEYIMKLREVGLLTDDKSTLEMLEFGQADKIFKDNLLHERRAYKENDLIKENPGIKTENTQGWIHPLEEKEIHVVIHSRLIFSDEFEKLSPNQQKTASDHAMETANQISKEKEVAQLKELEMIERSKIAASKPIEGAA